MPTIPEALFFRLMTKFIREYTEGCDLARNRCLFRIGNNLVVEFCYYNRGACLIVSMNGEADKKEAALSVSERAPEMHAPVRDRQRYECEEERNEWARAFVLLSSY